MIVSKTPGTQDGKMSIEYKIICHGDGRVLANLELDGTLVIHHDHFTDVEDFNVGEIIDALDRWAVRREITHLSKRGLNQKTVAQINAIQKAKPGEILFDFEPAAKIIS